MSDTKTTGPSEFDKRVDEAEARVDRVLSNLARPAPEKFLNVVEASPSLAGWYAVLLCWGPNEGYFPEAKYWDGSWQDDDGSLTCFWPDRFETEKDAKEYADTNDPNW
jgi:hypothetical protein